MFDQQFKVLLNDSIAKIRDIPGSIQRYQDARTNARMKLDYAVGPNLYLMPSDMLLKIGSI